MYQLEQHVGNVCLWGGTRGPKDNYFLKEVMLHIKLKEVKSRTRCREICASGVGSGARKTSIS